MVTEYMVGGTLQNHLKNLVNLCFQNAPKLLNPNHSLLLFAGLVDWNHLEKEFANFFSEEGAPAKPVRLVTGIFMLQHMSGLSDEETIKVWVENPYWQLFCGFDFLQWKCPLHPSSLSRWRMRLGKKECKRF